MITINEAIAIIHQKVQNHRFEIVPIESSIGRICAQDIIATIDLPRFNNSAMDGYAVLLSQANQEVSVLSRTLAGEVNHDILNSNNVIKVMTGAKVPDNAEAIVPIENVEILENENIKLPVNIKQNQHIRFIGEDIRSQNLLIAPQTKIDFSHISLLSSQGITHIKVYSKPRVAIFASGEELKLHYDSLGENQIYNSNTPTLYARAKELGCEVSFIGSSKDSVESLQELISCADNFDLIITSGGVSVGEADFTKEAFSSLGVELFFQKMHIKPGKPALFGKLKNCFVLNLPGNPLASNLVFEVIGKIIIQKLKNSNEIYHNYISTESKEDLNLKSGQYTVVPGYFDGDSFQALDKRAPGMVSVLSKANGIIITNNDVSSISSGDSVKFLPIKWEFFTSEKKDIFTK
jgi:molybdopterin molybdotransferase